MTCRQLMNNETCNNIGIAMSTRKTHPWEAHITRMHAADASMQVLLATYIAIHNHLAMYTHIGSPYACVWDTPYVCDVPYAYGPIYAYGAEHNYLADMEAI